MLESRKLGSPPQARCSAPPLVFHAIKLNVRMFRWGPRARARARAPRARRHRARIPPTLPRGVRQARDRQAVPPRRVEPRRDRLGAINAKQKSEGDDSDDDDARVGFGPISGGGGGAKVTLYASRSYVLVSSVCAHHEHATERSWSRDLSRRGGWPSASFSTVISHFFRSSVPENFLSCAVPENSSAAVSTSLRAVAPLCTSRNHGPLQIREHSAGLSRFLRRHVKIRLGRFKIALCLANSCSSSARRAHAGSATVGSSAISQACLELALFGLEFFCAVSLDLPERLVAEALALALF